MGKATRAAVMGAVLLAAACSGSPDDDIDVAPAAAEPTTTTTSTAPADDTSTTLSERARAEAEIEALVIAWYLAPLDSSKGDEGMRLEYLTGLVHRRVKEFGERTTAEGQVVRTLGGDQIEVLSTRVDLDAGRGEIDVCVGSSGALFDAETGDQLSADDPTYTTTALVYTELTDDGWRISEFFPSRNTDDPQLCDIEDD